jgi:hypothetical protein
MELIESLWEKASAMFSDSPLDSCGLEWGALAEGSAAALAEMVDCRPGGEFALEEESETEWWERAAGAGFKVVVGEREVHPAGRRGVAALETAFLFAMVSGFTGQGDGDSVVFDWRDGTPALSSALPGGGSAVMAATRRGVENGGLGMMVGMARRSRDSRKPELVFEAVLPTTANRVLAVRLEA